MERFFSIGSGIGYGMGMRPYAMELRERVWRALEEGESSGEVGERFGIDASCVRKWRQRKRQTGSVEPGGAAPGRKRELDAQHDEALREAVMAAPDAIRRELSEAVGRRLGRVFSEPVITRALQRLGFSRKKNSARQRAAASRRAGGAGRVGERRRAA